MSCQVTVIYLGSHRTVGGHRTMGNHRTVVYTTCDEPLPDRSPQRDIHWKPFDDEILKIWRRESRIRSKYHNPYEHKPLIKRRALISISGWLGRKGRLRKKGKK